MDKLCLKWEDFQKNLNLAFGELRDDKDFADVILACEDDFIEVHNIVLCASSPFFKKLLKKIKKPHPTIYMRGIKTKDLVSIVDFMYYGEVNIYQEDLNAFLILAEEMELKGLRSVRDPLEQYQDNDNKSHKKSVKTTQLKYDNFKYSEIETYPLIKTDPDIKADKQLVTIDKDLAEQIDSMLVKRDGLWNCTICGIGKNHKNHMKMHVEIHVEGLSYPCNNCGKTFRSRTTLKRHSSDCNNQIKF